MNTNFIVSLFLFWLKGNVNIEKNFVRITFPNTFLKVIPLGSTNRSIPVNQVSTVDDSFRLDIKTLIWGIVLLIISYNLFSSSLILALIIFIYGVGTLINAFETVLAVHSTSGAVEVIPFIIFEKDKALILKGQIEEIANYHNESHDLNIHRREQMNEFRDIFNNSAFVTQNAQHQGGQNFGAQNQNFGTQGGQNFGAQGNPQHHNVQNEQYQNNNQHQNFSGQNPRNDFRGQNQNFGAQGNPQHHNAQNGQYQNNNQHQSFSGQNQRNNQNNDFRGQNQNFGTQGGQNFNAHSGRQNGSQNQSQNGKRPQLFDRFGNPIQAQYFDQYGNPVYPQYFDQYGNPIFIKPNFEENNKFSKKNNRLRKIK